MWRGISMSEYRLDFSTRVLGKNAAKRLKHLNGFFLTFRSKMVNEYVFHDIYLDDKLLGRAWLTIPIDYTSSNRKANLGILDHDLATMGGFDTVEEQQKALKRAGYRFKPLNKYKAYPVIFTGYWGKKK